MLNNSLQAVLRTFFLQGSFLEPQCEHHVRLEVAGAVVAVRLSFWAGTHQILSWKSFFSDSVLKVIRLSKVANFKHHALGRVGNLIAYNTLLLS